MTTIQITQSNAPRKTDIFPVSSTIREIVENNGFDTGKSWMLDGRILAREELDLSLEALGVDESDERRHFLSGLDKQTGNCR